MPVSTASVSERVVVSSHKRHIEARTRSLTLAVLTNQAQTAVFPPFPGFGNKPFDRRKRNKLEYLPASISAFKQPATLPRNSPCLKFHFASRTLTPKGFKTIHACQN